MPRKSKGDDPNYKLRDLMRKSLILQLFELSVPQGDIAKKLRVDIHFISDFLKGVKKPNGKDAK